MTVNLLKSFLTFPLLTTIGTDGQFEPLEVGEFGASHVQPPMISSCVSQVAPFVANVGGTNATVNSAPKPLEALRNSSSGSLSQSLKASNEDLLLPSSSVVSRPVPLGRDPASTDPFSVFSSLFAIPPGHDSGYSSDDEDDSKKASSTKTDAQMATSTVGTLAVVAIGHPSSHGEEDLSDDDEDVSEHSDIGPFDMPLQTHDSPLPVFNLHSSTARRTNRFDAARLSSRSLMSQTSRSSRLLCDFDLSDELGRGGFGVVMSGRSRLDSRNYAVKIIPYTLPSGYSDPNDYVSELDCFREVRTMATMRGHDNVVRYFSAWHEEITPEIFDLIRDLDCCSTVDETAFSFAKASPPTEKIPNDNSFLRMASQSSSSLWNLGREFLGFGQIEMKSNDDTETNELVFEVDEDNPFGTFQMPMSAFVENTSELGSTSNNTRQESTEETPTHVLVIQMEMCDQGTLRDYLEDRERSGDEINKDECLQIFHQIVEGLHHIHEHNVLHRDIKPSNVFVSSEGEVKLGDFGLSVQQHEHFHLTNASSSESIGRTNHGSDIKNLTSGLGSPGYAAPEQLDDEKKYSKPADVYPLGLIFYELLSHFDTGMERVMALSDLRLSGSPSDEFLQMYPREAQVISSCLQLDPKARPSTKQILEHPIFNEISLMTSFNGSSESSTENLRRPTLLRRPSMGMATNLQSALRHKMVEIEILKSRISQLEAQLEKKQIADSI